MHLLALPTVSRPQRVESARATVQSDPPAGRCYSRVGRVSVSARSTGANDAE
jgi:hypothetical protein